MFRRNLFRFRAPETSRFRIHRSLSLVSLLSLSLISLNPIEALSEEWNPTVEGAEHLSAIQADSSSPAIPSGAESLGNNAFDISIPRPGSPSQLSTLRLESSKYSGGEFKRITCAYSSLKTALTCEARIAPNLEGKLPNLLSFVITDGERPDSPSNRKQYARFFVDLSNNDQPVVTAYTYIGVDELAAFYPILPPDFYAEPIVSTLNFGPNSFVNRLSKRINEENELVVNFQFNVWRVLKYLPNNLIAPDAWFGTGIGSQFGLKFTSYVGARVAYNRPNTLFSTAESSEVSGINNIRPGFIWEIDAGEYTILTANNLQSCLDCASRTIFFRSPLYWQSQSPNSLPSGLIFLPCQATGLQASSLAVQSAIRRNDPISNYIAAQLSILDIPFSSRADFLLGTLGNYKPKTLEGDFISMGNSIITSNSRVADLMAEAQGQAKRCDASLPFFDQLKPLFEDLVNYSASIRAVAPPRRFTTSNTPRVEAPTRRTTGQMMAAKKPTKKAKPTKKTKAKKSKRKASKNKGS